MAKWVGSTLRNVPLKSGRWSRMLLLPLCAVILNSVPLASLYHPAVLPSRLLIKEFGAATFSYVFIACLQALDLEHPVNLIPCLLRQKREIDGNAGKTWPIKKIVAENDSKIRFWVFSQCNDAKDIKSF